jgi:hypothetical protein
MKICGIQNKRWILLLALVSALLLGASETYAFAQPTTATAKEAKQQLRASVRSGAPTGQFTFQNKAGKTVTINYAKGLITAVDGAQLTLEESDGVSQTFTLSSATKVKIDKKLDTAGDLQPGMKALLISKQKEGQQPDVKRVKAHTPRSTSSQAAGGTTSPSTVSG